ncbi:SRPBCC family protein [Ancylobacter oerskovii]|uniref:SRPBCC family protein n=1 Tax=Ancylobacter oerskovii TaxID=459519 RepID=A0ABW4YUH5_9HYPH|nr:SRPBCC family protein [Ancylobacter oerskovii]MBS7544600.1 SRPBCC family protein [Ancylobacter oerskovii]
MSVRPALHIGIGIARAFEEVRAFLSDPANFPAWAEGLGHGFTPLGGREWRVETPLGPMRVRFTPPNPYGVLDHTLIPAEGAPMYNPMRVVANGEGSEVVFTLFRREGMDDAGFAADAEWVRRDLARLKALMEAG